MYTINEKRLFKIFKELAQISSPSWKEEKVVAYLEKFAKQNKIVFEEYPCDKSSNVMLRVPASDHTKKNLLFSAHTDTVTPCENIRVIETDSRFESDGTTVLGGDDKAGIAAALEMILSLKVNAIQHGELEFLFTCAEEVGLCGMKGMVMDKIKADFCFVLDSGGPIGTANIKAPFHSIITIHVKGKAAHAGMEPEKGINAINGAAHIISALPNGRIDHETTMNIGKIRGGKATNIVAAETVFTLEVRSIDKKKLLTLEKKIKVIIKEKAREFGVKVVVERFLEYAGYSIHETAPIRKHFAKACALAKIEPRYVASGGGSDTNVLNGSGHKAINLSAGMQKLHTNHEFLKKSDLIKLVQLALAIAEV